MKHSTLKTIIRSFTASLIATGMITTALPALADHTPYTGSKVRLKDGRMVGPIVVRQDWNEKHDQRMEWFRDARFGMFIHWGAFTQYKGKYKGDEHGEWIMRTADIPIEEYKAKAATFNPTKFNAAEWVKLAKDAGMKYIVITTKHHDGFVIYDSKETKFDIVDHTPFQRDPILELAEEAKKAGIKLGLYYSITDWTHPEFGEEWHGYHGAPNPEADLDKYVDYMQAQLKELLGGKYGDVVTLWFDEGGAFGLDPNMVAEGYNMFTNNLEYQHPDRYELLRTKETLDLIRSMQPNIIINDRLGNNATDYITPEQFVPDEDPYWTGQNFEVCMTITDDGWGYQENDVSWKSPREIIYTLVDVASKGGNLLLNIAPSPTGELVEQEVAALRGVGQWMKSNGESIYNTRKSSLPKMEWGRITERTNKDGSKRIYLHVFDWPEDGKLHIPGFTGDVRKIFPLSKGQNALLKSSLNEKGLSIDVGRRGRTSSVDPVIVIDM